MTRLALSVAALLGIAASLLLWRLLDAHRALGEATLAARLNANAVAMLQDQEQRNERLDRKLEQLAAAHDANTREILRDVYSQPAGDACRHSPAMRALDGRLRWQPGSDDGRPAAAAAPAQPVPPTGRPSR